MIYTTTYCVICYNNIIALCRRLHLEMEGARCYALFCWHELNIISIDLNVICSTRIIANDQ